MEQAILITVSDKPGTLFQLTKVLADQHANISYVDIIHRSELDVQVYFELELEGPLDAVISGLKMISNVQEVESAPPFSKIYGKRIIIMGGGAQVGQVALGAISEADRHNIRGERISVDTIPLVGERELAAAVRADCDNRESRENRCTRRSHAAFVLLRLTALHADGSPVSNPRAGAVVVV